MTHKRSGGEPVPWNTYLFARSYRHLRLLAFGLLLCGGLGSLGAVCISPQPPASPQRCPPGQDHVCNRCVPIATTVGAACSPDLCSGSPICIGNQGGPLACIGGTCQVASGVTEDCSTRSCATPLYCLDSTLPASPQCTAAASRARELASLLHASMPAVPAHSCEVYFAEGDSCDSDTRSARPSCAPCEPGLICASDATCRRACTPDATNHSPACPPTGSRCVPVTAAGNADFCNRCVELGHGCAAGATCCETNGTASSCASFGKCCAANGVGCTAATDCCGSLGTNGTCVGNTCRDCRPAGGACTAASDPICCSGTTCSLRPTTATDGLCCAPHTGHCTAGGTTCDSLETPANCGSCGHVCPGGANATATCTGGSCGLSCARLFGDCDGSPTNGCETSLSSDNRNCGRCGAVCSGGRTCSGGACVCSGGTTSCGTSCVDLRTDSGNCGTCGHRCAAGLSCSGGVCMGSGVCRGSGQTCTPGSGSMTQIAQGDCCMGNFCDSRTGTCTCIPPNTRVDPTAPSSFTENYGCCAGTALAPSTIGPACLPICPDTLTPTLCALDDTARDCVAIGRRNCAYDIPDCITSPGSAVCGNLDTIPIASGHQCRQRALTTVVVSLCFSAPCPPPNVSDSCP